MKAFLTRKYMGISFYFFLAFWVLALVGLILGSFYDLEFSMNFAKEGTGFGKFFESWGSVATTFIAPIGAGIMAKGLIRKDNKPWVIAVGIIFSIIAVGVVSYFNFSDFKGNEVTKDYGFTYPTLLALILAGVINVALFAIGFKFADKDAGAYRLATIGLTIIVCFALFQGTLNLFKTIAGRPRFRFLAWEDNAYSIADFRAWWQFSFGNKLASANKDALKSFPSGHTGGVAVYITLPLMFQAFSGTRDKKVFAVCGGLFAIAFTLLMAFARIRNGAHFISDVSFGALLATLCSFAVCALVEFLTKKFPNVNLGKTIRDGEAS